ncbi:hypothetical protein OF83DRAFT_1171961 [Amylostereum chailletii]|nr:hypothetical protein OF83DRAFT_1171961 [Amylostereum chailletii]
MSILQIVVAVVFIGVALWIVRRRRTLAPLRNIPGPPSASLVTGNLTQLYGQFASDFRLGISERYGRVIKLNGLLEEPILVVGDPKALSHMLVKDQNIFEESELVYEWVRAVFSTISLLIVVDFRVDSLG